MARGPSGRIVIEVDPELKRELHAAQVADGNTLKDWFIEQARAFLAERKQPRLPGLIDMPVDADHIALKVAEEHTEYRVTPKTPNPPNPTDE